MSYPLGARAAHIVLGDFNGDGIADAALARGDGAVSVVRGNADGSFQTPRQYSAGAQLTSVAVGDFNQDGVLDLAVTDGTEQNLKILLGTATGGSSRPALSASGQPASPPRQSWATSTGMATPTS